MSEKVKNQETALQRKMERNAGYIMLSKYIALALVFGCGAVTQSQNPEVRKLGFLGVGGTLIADAIASGALSKREEDFRWRKIADEKRQNTN